MRRLIDRSRGDSGTAALQFALIVPLLLLLVFGIMEFSLLLRDDIAMNNLVRDASRVASTNPRVGNALGHDGDGPGAEASFAYYAAKMVEESGSALPKDSITDMYVYLANAEGYPTTTPGWKSNSNRTMTTCPPEYCVHYVWIDATDRFVLVNGTWDPATINACPRGEWLIPDSPDLMAVGVYLRVDHVGLFKGLFNLTLTLTDRNVVMFEPMPGHKGTLPGDCGPPYPYRT